MTSRCLVVTGGRIVLVSAPVQARPGDHFIIHRLADSKALIMIGPIVRQINPGQLAFGCLIIQLYIPTYSQSFLNLAQPRRVCMIEGKMPKTTLNGNVMSIQSEF